MSAAAPQDGGSNSEHLKDKLKHPFNNLREKFRDTKLYDLKVGLIHKKYCPPSNIQLHNSFQYLILKRHEIGKFANLVNPNHRHDEEHEKETDDKRTRITESHRFNSFAPERPGNNIKWYVDGRDYCWVSTLHVWNWNWILLTWIGGLNCA